MKRNFFACLYFLDEIVGSLRLLHCSSYEFVRALSVLYSLHGFNRVVVECDDFDEPLTFETDKLYFKGFDFSSLV